MPVNLKGRSLLTLKDYTPEEIRSLLDLAHDLKRKKRAGVPGDLLRGRNIILIFEKTSTRTRCAFEVACMDEGGGVTYLSNSQMGKKESLEDTARVLGRYYDGIAFRGFKQETAEGLARWSGVPVWNGLTDDFHPTQILADLMTLEEHVRKPLSEMKLCFIGDARSNMGNSLLIGAAKCGMAYTAIAPKALWTKPNLVEEMQTVARETGARLALSESLDDVSGADAVYTDVWVSMGEERHFAERIALLRPYQVTADVMRATGNPDALFLHCLPSFHDLETETGRDVFGRFGLKEMEVTDEVFRSRNSRVFDEAENRMHAIKAALVATIGARSERGWFSAST